MNKSKRVAAVVVGIFLVWVGLCQIGAQVPFAGERSTAAPSSRSAGGMRTALPAGAVDLRCEVEPPTTVLSVVPSGQAVKKGDLLVELDVSALVEKRIQQVHAVKKAETEMVLAKESQEREKRAAAGQVALAEKALRVAQGQLKAYQEGEYPNQLALASGTLALAEQRRLMAECRFQELKAAERTQDTEKGTTALQEADLTLREAQLQSMMAQNALASLKGFVHDNKVAERELTVAQHEFDLARAQDAVSAAATRGATTLSLAEMSYRMEADRLAKLDDQIARGKIYTPQDGTVVYPVDTDAPIQPGTVVRNGQVLVRLLPETRSQP
jgi:HlyD family secretion protein